MSIVTASRSPIAGRSRPTTKHSRAMLNACDDADLKEGLMRSTIYLCGLSLHADGVGLDNDALDDLLLFRGEKLHEAAVKLWLVLL